MRRLEEFAGVAVLDLAVEPPLEGERITALRAPLVARRGRGAGARRPGLRYDAWGAPRTVVLDASRPLAVGEIVAVVRRETAHRHRGRGPLDRVGAVSDHLELLPAVDVADGQAVQLVQGVAGSEKRFGDPVEAALRWQEAGAEWIHLVDLDAAFGRGHNRELLAAIVGRVDVQVELSGGIRDDESLAAAMATGCRRVNIGTAALEQPEWCAAAIAEWGDRVAVGLDVRGRTLAARGWTREGGDLYEVLARLDGEGCARYVVTDVNKDGMLQGPNLQLLRTSAARPSRPVVASGGITELDDLARAGRPGAGRGRGRDHRHRALRGPLHARGRADDDPGRRDDASPSA